jgi:GMP synthase-like glutamine amidotransferase
MPKKQMLFISMLGEQDLYDPDDYRELSPSGLEKDWIVDWFGGLAGEYGFHVEGTDVIRGGILADPKRFHSVILGGTIHLVLEDRPWLKTILKWIQAYRRLRRPLLGICGGHQMIAVHFSPGSQLIKRENGPLNGTYPIRLTESGKTAPLFQGIPDKPQFHFSNHYHVIPAPGTEMNILATTVDSPAVAVDYGDHWYGSQFHPESRLETWACYCRKDSTADLENYRSDHAGLQVMKNFFKISQNLAHVF